MRRRWIASVLALLVALGAAVFYAASPRGPRTLLVAPPVSISALAVDSATSRVYIGLFGPPTTAPRVAVLDEATGQLVRSINVQDSPAFADLPGGHILLTQSTTSGSALHLSLLDARTGATLRSMRVPLARAFWQSFTAHDGYAVLASGGVTRCGIAAGTCRIVGSGIALLDTRTGRLRRLIPAATEVADLDARTHTILTVGRDSRRRLLISRYDAVTGRLLSQHPLPLQTSGTIADPTDLAIDQATGRAFLLLFAEPPGPPGVVVSWGAVAVLDARRGTLLRLSAVSGRPAAMAVDERTNRIFIAASGPTGMSMKAAPPSFGGMGGSVGYDMPLGRGTVYVLDARSGATLAAVPTGVGPQDLAIDAQRGRLYVANTGERGMAASIGSANLIVPPLVVAPGSLSTLDARTGRVLATTTLGVAPTFVALDGAGRVVVADEGDAVPHAVADPWGWLPLLLRRRLPLLPPRPPGQRATPGGVLVVDTSRQ